MSASHFKLYEISWSGMRAFYAAASAGKARAAAWRSASTTYGDRHFPFARFLRESTCKRARLTPEGFGDRILVCGAPAFRIAGVPGVNNYVTFHRPNEDILLYAHPLDVEECVP